METLNEFTLMGKVVREGIKKFEYAPPNSFNADGTKKVKLGMEFYLEVPQNVGGGDLKIRLVTYNRAAIENLIERIVVIKGFFKVQTYTSDDGIKNYVTKLVVQENGGVIYYGNQPQSFSTQKNHENQQGNNNEKVIRQVFKNEIVDNSSLEDEWIDSQVREDSDIWE